MKILIRFDVNGNKCISVPGNEAGRRFNIQTNGVLPLCHRLPKGEHHLSEGQAAELADAVRQFGTKAQKCVLETHLKQGRSI